MFHNLVEGRVVAAALAVSVSLTSVADIRFEDVTEAAGFTYKGPSWGGAWADVNKDGRPDLWVTNHVNAPNLFLNQGDGTFLDVAEDMLSEEVYSISQEYDAHGAAWADFDNDGDPDLIQLVGADLNITGTGSSSPHLFFVNQGGVLEERGAEFGLGFIDGRGRMPLWMDSNNDGWVDLYVPTRTDLGTAPTALFEQTPLGFVDRIVDKGIQATINRNYALLGDIDGAPGLELSIEENMRFPLQILETGSEPFLDIQPGLDPIPFVGGLTQDVVIADMDGDLDNDMFYVRGEKNSEVVQTGTNVLEGHLTIGGNVENERGVQFSTDGDVEFILKFLKRKVWPLSSIFIGSQGVNPQFYQFELSAQDPVNHGVAEHTPGLDKGLYIGFDTAEQRWVFLFSTASVSIVDFLLSSTAPIDSFQAVGWDPASKANPDIYFVNSGTGFTNMSEELGILTPTSSRSIVAGDFDNDMDLDLYMVSTGPVQNLPNMLFENQGDGRLIAVPDGAGAGGTIDGRGDAVAMADYDGDGYLDLFTTNGKSRRPFEEDGPVQLFRNLGGTNHWIELDLEGVASNRDGIGARIELTAGGVTQLREQTAGIHARAQNHMRVHFGLGANTLVDSIKVHWPSGTIQQIENLSADQIFRVTENALPPDHAPVISTISDQTVIEGNSTGPLLFSVGDFGKTPELLVVTASSSNKALVPDAGLVITGESFNRSIDVTPAPGQSGGPATISVEVSDGTSIATTTFDVVVTPANKPPVANSDSASVKEGGSVVVNVLENDDDVDDGLDVDGVQITTQPEYGTVNIDPGGSVNYLQTVSGAVSDSFEYTVKDMSGALSNTAEVSIVILPPDNIPDDVLLALGLNPDAPGGDSDGDGVSDSSEIGPDIENPLDQDGDGVIDALEAGDDAADASVAAGLPLENNVMLELRVLSGEQLSNVVLLKPGAEGAPAGVSFPFGALSYTTSSQPGGSASLQLSLSVGLPANFAVYKVDVEGNYIELPSNLWRRIDDSTIEITVTDGDPMTDSDGSINGSIDDPLALGSVTPAATGGGGGGGCSIGSGGNGAGLPLMLLFLLSYFSRAWVLCAASKGRRLEKTSDNWT